MPHSLFDGGRRHRIRGMVARGEPLLLGKERNQMPLEDRLFFPERQEANSRLFFTSKSGDLKGVKEALEDGADVNARNRDCMTPFMLACFFNKNLTITRCLISHGADANARDDKGRTAVMLAIENGRTAIVNFLISIGADLNTPDLFGCTPLGYSYGSGDTSITELLRKHGAKD